MSGRSPLARWLAGLALVLSGCGGAEPTHLRIGASAATPLHAAMGEVLSRTDILARHGLTGEILSYDRGSDQYASAASGAVDATFTCEVAAIVHLSQLPGTALTASPGSLGNIALVVPAGSPVMTPADLRGASVAVLEGASTELLAQRWFDAADPTLWASLRVEPRRGHGADIVVDLLAGRLDAAVLGDPWLTLHRGVLELRVLEQAPFWSVTLEYPDRLPAEAWERYHSSLQDALAFVAAHPDEVSGWVAARSGLSVDVVRAVLLEDDAVAGRRAPSLSVAPEVRERLEACARFAVDRRLVPAGFLLGDRTRWGPRAQGEPTREP